MAHAHSSAFLSLLSRSLSFALPVHSLTLLLKDEIHVFGRAIAAHLRLPPNTSLLLGLGLKDHNLQLIPPLLSNLEPFRTWTTR